jgi:hypothetical protein
MRKRLLCVGGGASSSGFMRFIYIIPDVALKAQLLYVIYAGHTTQPIAYKSDL